MSGLQPIEDLEAWHATEDPWAYEDHADDARRVEVLLSELPELKYRRVLDIGCGQGFVTQKLPGDSVLGVDVSANAVAWARRHQDPRLNFEQASLFDLPARFPGPFDLVVVTGVLYPQYIGKAQSLARLAIDRILARDGVLASVHIREWCSLRFPYLMLGLQEYPYREFTHRLEVYVK